ncbi:unnamed protein product [Cuscuta campestris]|uniref:SBP-type domain-containing protein n=1 Tax=Cuscuta campestris TaxID=132261 RepID=A0A484MZY9_9ASTE|nr:unnamed protein product [Cuscuta campestris]
MLDYEWGTQSSATAMFPGEDTSAQNRHFFDLYATQANFNEDAAGGPGLVGGHNGHFSAEDHLQLFHHPAGDGGQETNHMCSLYDPRAYGGASFAQASHHHQVVPMLSLEPGAAAGFVVVPKSEPLGISGGADFSGANLGLNLGGRTYFSSTEDDFVNRLYRRSRVVDATSFNAPRCQAEGCTADLTLAKHYHRRHKVCDFHSKAATVLAAGLTQRFCQQCSRFHVLTEFDNGKRSCRRRLADHNRRRRKVPQPNHQENSANTTSHQQAADTNNAAAHNSPSSDSLPSQTLMVSAAAAAAGLIRIVGDSGGITAEDVNRLLWTKIVRLPVGAGSSTSSSSSSSSHGS